MYRGGRQPVASGGRARAARGRRLPLQRRHHHLSRGRSAAPTRFRRSRTSWPASTTTPASRRRSARPSSRRPIRTSASTRRTSGRSARALTLNAGLRYDLQFLETHQHRHQQRLAAARASPGRRSTRGDTVVRGSAGLFFDRVPLRALANALLSAGNTTDLDEPAARPASACRRPRPARRRSRTSSAAPCRSVTLVNSDDDGSATCRTRYSRQAQRRSRAAARRRAARSASATSTCAA